MLGKSLVKWVPVVSFGSSYYIDVIMSAMTSQLTSLTIFFSIVYSGADQRKQQSSASLAFVRGIHRWPMNSSHKGPVTLKTFPFDDVISEDLFNHDYHIVSSNVSTARTNTICVWRHYLINRSVITKNGKMVAMEKVWYILARRPKVSRSHKGQLHFSFRWSFVRRELYVISGILRLGTVEWNSHTESMPYYELVISDTKPTLPIWLSVSLYW